MFKIQLLHIKYDISINWVMLIECTNFNIFLTIIDDEIYFYHLINLLANSTILSKYPHPQLMY
jgi:hypothetical protein